MALIRHEHWATRHYHNYLLAQKDVPFVWGKHDCCTAAADAIQSYTGVDIADDFRGKYTDRESAFALIKEVTGGSTVADAAAYCAAKHGLVEWKWPLFAQRGDLVVVEDAGVLIAGVVHLTGRHVVVLGESGLKRVSTEAVRRAWKV